MPAPGDVDVVIAAELMEAGRSILRGLVTPDRTTLIASTHRCYAVAEKEKPGDGIADPNIVVADAAGVAAKRTIAFDMELLANKNNSHISACLFGTLAASGTLPFGREAFEAIIKAGGKGIEPSLNAFRAAYDQAAQPPAAAQPVRQKIRQALFAATSLGRASRSRQALERASANSLSRCATCCSPGVKQLTDFQDPAYANEYLDRIAKIYEVDRATAAPPSRSR